MISNSQDSQRLAFEVTSASTLRNETILKKLLELNIHPDLLATLTMVPLVETAWADGKIQENERTATLNGASKIGMGKEGSVDYTIVFAPLDHAVSLVYLYPFNLLRYSARS